MLQALRPPLVGAGLLALLGAASSPAAACSRHEGYPVPSHFESVMLADAVVLARADGVEALPEPATPGWGFRARFAVLETIAGGPVGSTVELRADAPDAAKSPKDDFLRGRPSGSLCCFCVGSWGFAPGHLYVLLLQKGEGGGFGVGQLAREAEQVDSTDAPWAVAVRHYARIARLATPEERRSALLELRDRAARGEEPAIYPRGLVADIDDHLGRPHPTKGFDELVALAAAQSDPRDARMVLWSIDGQGAPKDTKDPEDRNASRATAYFASLLDHGLGGHRLDEAEWSTLLAPIAEHARRRGSLALVERLVTLFPRLAPTGDGSARLGTALQSIVGAVSASCARIPSAWVLAVASSANDEELAELACGYPDHRLCEPALEEVRRRVAGDYDRAYPSFRQVLARAGDEEAARWADERLDGEIRREDLAAWMLLLSPAPEADARVRRRIDEAADAVLAELVRVLLSDEVPERDERLAAIAARLATADGAYPKLRAVLDEWRHQAPERVALVEQRIQQP